jgi:hypothetical protein
LSAYINGIATCRAAYAWYRSVQTGKAMVWSKTEHVFPTETALAEFRRQIGQILIDQDKLSTEELGLGLEEQRHSRLSLGETLVRLGFVKERDVVEAFAEQSGAATALNDDLVPEADMVALLPEAVARALTVLPLRIERGEVVLAVSHLLSPEEERELARVMDRNFVLRFAEASRVRAAIDRTYSFNDERRKPLGRYLVDRGDLDEAGLLQMLELQRATDKPLLQLLSETGTIDGERLHDVLQDYFDVHTAGIDGDAAITDGELARVPRDFIADNEVTIVRSGSGLRAASAFPLAPKMARMLSDAMGEPVECVVARKGAVLHSRRELLRRIAAAAHAAFSGS